MWGKMAASVEKIGIVIIFVLCCSAVKIDDHGVLFHPDKPFLSAKTSINVELTCCFQTGSKPVNSSWIRNFRSKDNVTSEVQYEQFNHSEPHKSACFSLFLESVTLNDSGLYRCQLNKSYNLLTHGTYLHVYKPLDKTINLSESTKNKILTAEGILLLLCVVLPSATLLFKSKRVSSLEGKKVKKEEENIYQGLNLDDCCSTYDQIERSPQGPYQDVCNVIEEEEEIQLEKP